MKRFILIILTIILGHQGYSQITFEKGYFIDNANQKVECLIKNMDWGGTPTEFVYKTSEDGPTQKGTINLIKEFGLYNIGKFVRKTVDIDRSAEGIRNLTYNKNPEFQEEKLFLKVLVEGKASLYEYVDTGLVRYFYTVDNSDIEQLVFKSYRAPLNQVGKNNQYKQQLHNDLQCSSINVKKIENLNYRESDLSRFFIEYNKCSNAAYTDFREKRKTKFLNLSIRPGIRSSSYSLENNILSSRNADFGSQVGFTIGLEAEFILPFNKNKWAILLEPTYQYYKAEGESRYQTLKLDYKSLEIPIGGRHYFFISPKSKVFVNASLVFDISNSKIEFETMPDVNIKSNLNFAFGLGYKFNDRYSLELRYFTNRNIIESYVNYDSEYKSVAVLLGYTLF